MSGLTLSPSDRVFVVAIVALAASSAATLTGLIHRWCRASPVSFLPMYAAIIAIVAALALVLLGVPVLDLPSPRAVALALTGGSIACWAALRVESLIARAQFQGQRRRVNRPFPVGSELVRPDLAGTPATGGTAVLAWLLVVGAGEEVLFRGILVSLAGLAPGGSGVYGTLIMASIVAFALSHAQAGFGEVLRKMPLSVACFAAYVMFGTLLAPIAAHVAYNACTWRARPPLPARDGAGSARGLVRGQR
jgi:membrane protease YdiL (CAAX protease family)